MSNKEIKEMNKEEITKLLSEYDERFHLFKDAKDGSYKVKYVIEDTRKIRFFEFADDIIEKDVFNADEDLEVFAPKKRGRPRKYPISNDPPKPKRKPGRPKSIEVEVKEGESRKHKVCEKYLNKRYKTDEKFRENLKQKRRDRYLRQKTDSDNSDETVSEEKNI